MNRLNLWLAGLQILSLAAIAWLWRENRSLRAMTQVPEVAALESTAEPAGQGIKIPFQGKSTIRPHPGSADRPPAKTRETGRNSPLSAANRHSGRSNLKGSEAVPSNLKPDQEMPAEPPPGLETGLPARTPPNGESLLANGGFDEGLEPWICEQGSVIEDPDDSENLLLEATIDEEVFSLRQTFNPPSGRRLMSLSFRAKLSGEVKSPGFLVKLFSRDGRELVGTFVEAGKSGEWKEIHWHSRGPLAIPPAALQIASISGKGVIWIDDVKLESSTADPEVPQD